MQLHRTRHRSQPRARRRHRAGAPRFWRGLRGRPRHHEHHEPRRHPGPARRDQRRRHRRRGTSGTETFPSSSTTRASSDVPHHWHQAPSTPAGRDGNELLRLDADGGRASAPVLRDNGGGALVNVLSVLSFISMPQGATYSASKAAAWSLTNALRIELRRQGTLVVAVHAGFIDTDMAAGVSERKISPRSVASRSSQPSKPTPRRSSPIRPARW